MKAPLKVTKTPAERVFNELVEQDEREWRVTLKRRSRSGEIDADAWDSMMQKRLEWCALQMEKGSRSQSIVVSTGGSQGAWGWRMLWLTACAGAGL